MDLFPTRRADPLALSESDKALLREVLKAWEGKSVEEEVNRRPGSQMKAAMNAGLTTLGGHTTSIGNITPDYEMVLQKALLGLKSQIERQREATTWEAIEDGEKAIFYDAALVALDAAIEFSARFGALARDMAGRKKEGRPRPERRPGGETSPRMASKVHAPGPGNGPQP